MKIIHCIALLTCMSPGFAQNKKEIGQSKKEVILLGVYHFDNPGQDSYNTEVDDYFSENRQKEIEEVVSRLKKFQPTKVFVEARPERQVALDSLYRRYKGDEISLKEIPGGRNEVYQIGFRLAKQLNLPSPLAIDYQGYWLGDYVDFIADTLAYSDYLNYQVIQADNAIKKSREYQSNSILQNLTRLNEWDNILANHHYYNNIAIHVRDTAKIMFQYQEQEAEIDGLPYLMRSFDFNEIGVEMIAEWYKRNLFIYRSILDQTQKEDRVLIIIGSGHIRYLHQLLDDNPEFKITQPNRYLKN